MSQMLPQKTFVQKIQEKVSSFFRENTLGILVLGIIASVIAAYIYANRDQLLNEVISLLPYIIVLCLVLAAWWWDKRTLRAKLSKAQAELGRKDLALDNMSDAQAELGRQLSEAQAELGRKDLALDNMSDALSFDYILLILLTKFVSVPRAQQMNKLKEILQKLLENAVLAKVGYDGVFRASIFLPTEGILNQLLSDVPGAGGNAPTSQSASESVPATTSQNHEEDDYITIWVHIGLDSEAVNAAKCYIGDKPDIQRGFAGLAFKGTEPLVAHMVEQDGKWICKEYPGDYKQFEKYPVPRYRALAAAPIVTLGRTKRKTVGVICFDSMNATLFDGAEARKALVTVGTRIGAIFSIYWQLSQKDRMPPNG